MIEVKNPDIVVGTESWLTPNHYSGEIFPQQYQVFRKDRKSDAHGRVFIATKLDLVALLREDLSHPNSELLWVQLQYHGGGRIIIGAFYRSQQTDEAYIETLRPSLEKNPVHDNICRKTIGKNQNAIECEKCLSWFHQKCMNMSDAHFKVLAEHPSYVWLCCMCGLPSFNSSLFLSEIETSNRYDDMERQEV